jgi:hypothetical protein
VINLKINHLQSTVSRIQIHHHLKPLKLTISCHIHHPLRHSQPRYISKFTVGSSTPLRQSVADHDRYRKTISQSNSINSNVTQDRTYNPVQSAVLLSCPFPQRRLRFRYSRRKPTQKATLLILGIRMSCRDLGIRCLASTRCMKRRGESTKVNPCGG